MTTSAALAQATAAPAGAPRPLETGRRLRILAFTSLFPNPEQPLHGLFVRERIRALAERCTVRVAAPVPWVPRLPVLPSRYAAYRRIASQEHDGGTAVYHPRFFVFPKVMKSTDGFLMGLSCLPAVARIRRVYPFDLIDAHWAYPDGVAAALVANRLRVPLAITVRGDDMNVFAAERGRGPIIGWALRRAALVVALSEDLKARVESLTNGTANVVVVSNGVDADRFHPVDRDAARRALGLDSQARVVITVGRLHTSKGIPQLIEAFAALPRQFEDVRLFVIGGHDSEADARPAIAATISRHGLADRVRLVGAQTPDQLVAWYSAADLFCSATTREGSPNVLLEATACGLPCVTTAVGGSRDVVASPEMGVLVTPEPAALAEAMSSALTRRWNRRRIAEGARRRTWATVAEECQRHLLRVAPSAS
jgi:glycosyltransferase involved in cell wall biosynthesis